MLGRIWKGEALCKNTGLLIIVSTAKRMDIYTREADYHTHVSLRRSDVERGVMVSSRGAGWAHSLCEISVDFTLC